MKNKIELILAGLAAGRVALHLVALAAGGHWRWHWAGIMRELRAGLALALAAGRRMK